MDFCRRKITHPPHYRTLLFFPPSAAHLFKGWPSSKSWLPMSYLALSRLTNVPKLSHPLVEARQSGALSWPTLFCFRALKGFSASQNGSQLSLRKRRPRSSKMSLSWSCHGERACATSLSIKVRSLYNREGIVANGIRAESKVVYRRYASLFFIAGCSSTDNELVTLEIVHRYVEQMDKYYGNVCELDIIFNFQKAYFILDELLLAGEMQESSKKNVLRCISQQDSLEDMEVS